MVLPGTPEESQPCDIMKLATKQDGFSSRYSPAQPTTGSLLRSRVLASLAEDRAGAESAYVQPLLTDGRDLAIRPLHDLFSIYGKETSRQRSAVGIAG